MSKYTKETIAHHSPITQLHMLAQLEDLAPEEVLAVARVHAITAIAEAEAIVRETTGLEGAEAQELVQELKDNPLPYMATWPIKLARWAWEA